MIVGVFQKKHTIMTPALKMIQPKELRMETLCARLRLRQYKHSHSAQDDVHRRVLMTSFTL